MDPGDSNSGPCACTASVSPPSNLPSSFFLFGDQISPYSQAGLDATGLLLSLASTGNARMHPTGISSHGYVEQGGTVCLAR